MSRRRVLPADPVDRTHLPLDEWRLVESRPNADLGLKETLFATANGYLGMRGTPEEGRDAERHGTFLNGFHETWTINHAESAFGFARTGQTMISVPDSSVLKLYVDDEPLLLSIADLEEYERWIDFREGVLRRELIWRTPAGKRVRVSTSRMVSFPQRHLALMTLRVQMLDGAAPIAISSQIINREDFRDDFGAGVDGGPITEKTDPRQTTDFTHRVLEPLQNWHSDRRMLLGYRVANSGMTLAIGADHHVESEAEVEQLVDTSADLGRQVVRAHLEQGQSLTVRKAVTYHSSRSVPHRELFDRCRRTLDRVRSTGFEAQFREQRSYLEEFWRTSDVELPGQPAAQQATRWNLFQIAQAAARSDQWGIPAKGVTGSGYEGHYFWDSEVYVVPFLTFTQPRWARNALRFRTNLLPKARERARELNQRGALFPWRTINGDEASAYYAAGTAQYHIDADVAYAFAQYTDVTGDIDFQHRDGVRVLVETARMWADLGFWRLRADGTASFHVNGVTGPDEYTTVVNNNMFTNVMARYNLRRAAQAVRELRAADESAYEAMRIELDLDELELEQWVACADGMHVAKDESLGIHLQEDRFLEREISGSLQHPRGRLPAAAELPSAGDLPLPGDQAGGRRARAVPAGQRVHGRGEARGLRVLRPDHHRGLLALGGGAVDHGRGGRASEGRPGLLPLRTLRGPRQPPPQHRRWGAHRLRRRGLERPGARLRGDAARRGTGLLRPAPARRLARAGLPAHRARLPIPGAPGARGDLLPPRDR